MLKFETNEIPEGFESHYTKTESGSYRLNVEGVVPEAEYQMVKAKNNEFRTNNVELLKQNSMLKNFESLFGQGDLKPETIQKKIDDLAAARAESLVQEMKTKHDQTVKELTLDRDGKRNKLSQLALSEAVRQAGAKHGVLATAFDDVYNRAVSAWEVDDEGQPKLKQEKLDANGQAYTVDSWMAETIKVAPHLAAPSRGTGASPSIRKPGSAKAADQSERSPQDLIASGLQKRFAGNGTRKIN